MNKRTQILLTSLFLMPENELPYDQIDVFTRSIGYKSTTMDRYLSTLSGDGYLSREREYNHKFFKLTNKGKISAIELYNTLSKQYFTPKKHNTTFNIPVNRLLEEISDPFFKIFLMNMYLKKNKFALMDILHANEIYLTESNSSKLFEKLSNQAPEYDTNKIIDILHHIHHENSPKEKFAIENQTHQYIESSILQSDVCLKSGRFLECEQILKTLQLSPNLPPSLYFILQINFSKLRFKEGNIEEALKILSELRKQYPKGSIEYGIATQKMADNYTILCDFDKAFPLFAESEPIYERLKDTALIGAHHNNLGVLHFNLGDIDTAYHYWKKAEECSDIRSYNLAVVIPNMASYHMQKRNWKKAQELLDKGEKIFNDIGSLYGSALIEYNRCLYYILRKEIKKALYHHKRSLTIGHPFPTPYNKNEWLRIVIRELEKMEFDEKTINEFRKINTLNYDSLLNEI